MTSSSRSLFFGLIALFMLLTNAAFSQDNPCGNINNGSISFYPGSCSVLPEAKSRLALLAEDMRANPACRVIIVSNAGGNKPAQQLSWERVYAVIEQMSESSNIDRNRFIFVYDGVAGSDMVDFRPASAGEDGPSSVPPPNPGGKGCR